MVFKIFFRPEDITAFDEKTGVTVEVKLQKTYLPDVVIPRILPYCSSHLSSLKTSRESPNSWRIRLENSALKSVLNQSITDDLDYKKEKKFHSMNDQEGKLNFLDRNYWSVVRQQETLILCSMIKSPYPKINLSLVIEFDFAVHVFCRNVEINKIRDYNVRRHVTDLMKF